MAQNHALLWSLKLWETMTTLNHEILLEQNSHHQPSFGCSERRSVKKEMGKLALHLLITPVCMTFLWQGLAVIRTNLVQILKSVKELVLCGQQTYTEQMFCEERAVHSFITRVKTVLATMRRNEFWSFKDLEISYFFIWVAVKECLFDIHSLNHFHVLCKSLYHVTCHNERRDALMFWKLVLVAYHRFPSCSILCGLRNMPEIPWTEVEPACKGNMCHGFKLALVRSKTSLETTYVRILMKLFSEMS